MIRGFHAPRRRMHGALDCALCCAMLSGRNSSSRSYSNGGPQFPGYIGSYWFLNRAHAGHQFVLVYPSLRQNALHCACRQRYWGLHTDCSVADTNSLESSSHMPRPLVRYLVSKLPTRTTRNGRAIHEYFSHDRYEEPSFFANDAPPSKSITVTFFGVVILTELIVAGLLFRCI